MGDDKELKKKRESLQADMEDYEAYQETLKNLPQQETKVIEDEDSGLDNFVEGLEIGGKNLVAGAGKAISEYGSSLAPTSETLASLNNWSDDYRDSAPEADGSTGQFIGQMVPSVLPTLTGAVLSATPLAPIAAPFTYASIGALTLGSAGMGMYEYEDYMTQNGLEVDHGDMLKIGTISGVVEAVSEKVGLGSVGAKGTKMFLKKSAKEIIDAGDDLLARYAVQNPQMMKQVAKHVAKNANAEGLEEATVAIANDITANHMYLLEDDQRGVKTMAENALHSYGAGALMGSFIGPISYGAQNATNKRRRKEQGRVVLGKYSGDQDVVEIAQKTEDGYTIVTADGEFKEVKTDEIGQQLSVPIDSFYDVLNGKSEGSKVEQEVRKEEALTDLQNQEQAFQKVRDDFAYQKEDGNEIIKEGNYKGIPVVITGQDATNKNLAYVVDPQTKEQSVVNINEVQNIQETAIEDVQAQMITTQPPVDSPHGTIQRGESVNIEGREAIVFGVSPDGSQVTLKAKDQSGEGVEHITLNSEEFESFRNPQQAFDPRDDIQEKSNFDSEGNIAPTDESVLSPKVEPEFTQGESVINVNEAQETIPLKNFNSTGRIEVDKQGMDQESAANIATALNKKHPNANFQIENHTGQDILATPDFRVVHGGTQTEGTTLQNNQEEGFLEAVEELSGSDSLQSESNNDGNSSQEGIETAKQPVNKDVNEEVENNTDNSQEGNDTTSLQPKVKKDANSKRTKSGVSKKKSLEVDGKKESTGKKLSASGSNGRRITITKKAANSSSNKTKPVKAKLSDSQMRSEYISDQKEISPYLQGTYVNSKGEKAKIDSMRFTNYKTGSVAMKLDNGTEINTNTQDLLDTIDGTTKEKIFKKGENLEKSNEKKVIDRTKKKGVSKKSKKQSATQELLTADPDNPRQLILQRMVNEKLDVSTTRKELSFTNDRAEFNSRIWLWKKGGKTVDQLTLDIIEEWETKHGGELDQREIRDEILDVIRSHNTKGSIQNELYDSFTINGKVVQDSNTRAELANQEQMLRSLGDELHSNLSQADIDLLDQNPELYNLINDAFELSDEQANNLLKEESEFNKWVSLHYEQNETSSRSSTKGNQEESQGARSEKSEGSQEVNKGYPSSWDEELQAPFKKTKKKDIQVQKNTDEKNMASMAKSPFSAKHKGKVENILKEVTKGWKNAPKATVYEGILDFAANHPEYYQNMYSRSGGEVLRSGAWYDPSNNQIHIIAANPINQTKEGLAKTIIHESLGHYGLRGFVQKQSIDNGKVNDREIQEEFNKVIDSVVEKVEGSKEWEDLRKFGYGDQGKKGNDKLTLAEKRELAEEIIAHRFENEGVNDPISQSVINWFRKLWSSITGRHLKASDMDIAQLMSNARRYVVVGGNHIPRNTINSNIPKPEPRFKRQKLEGFDFSGTKGEAAYKAFATINTSYGPVKVTFWQRTDSTAWITPTLHDEPIGAAMVIKNSDGTWHTDALDVDDDYQRQGIATAMYDIADRSGHKLVPSDLLLEDGAKFWEWRENNPYEENGVRFKLSKSVEKVGDMVALHNIRDSYLKNADNIGGLPMPSLAVTTKDHPFESFGDISLVGDSNLIDPKVKGNNTFAADVYSPRYPSVTYEADYKQLENRFGELESELSGDHEFSVHKIYSDMEDGGVKNISRNRLIKYAYLKDTGKKIPKIDKLKKPSQNKELNNYIKKKISESDDWDYSGYRSDEEFKKLYSEVKMKEFSKLPFAKNVYSKPTEHLLLSEVDLFNRVKNFKGGNDYSSFKRKLDEKTGQDKKFQEWIENEFENNIHVDEKLFKGYTHSGNRQYLSHNIDNVMKLMKKDLRGGEGGSYGIGKARASYTPKFKSISDIKKNKDRIVSSEEFKKYKEKADEDFTEITNSLDKYYGSERGFGFMDNVIEMIAEANKIGLDRSLKEWGFNGVPESVKTEIREFQNELASMPTEYFEAKITRAVGLGEFNAAVVPNGTDKKTLSILKNKGLKIVKYNPSIKTDRQEKLNKYLDKNPEVRFKKSLQTDTKEFKKWFGDSKVVNEDGSPKEVFHGTERGGFSKFDEYEIGNNTGNASHGFYFSSERSNANTYAGKNEDFKPATAEDIFNDPSLRGDFNITNNEDGTYIVTEGKHTTFDKSDEATKEDVMEYIEEEMVSNRSGIYPTYLSMNNPYVIDFKGRDFTGSKNGEFDGEMESISYYEDEAKKLGHDGLIAENIIDEGRRGKGYEGKTTTYVVFEPTQIKSSTENNGQFDTENSDIRFKKSSEEPTTNRAMIQNQLSASASRMKELMRLESIHPSKSRKVEMDTIENEIKRLSKSLENSLSKEEATKGGDQLAMFKKLVKEPVQVQFTDRSKIKGKSIDVMEVFGADFSENISATKAQSIIKRKNNLYKKLNDCINAN